MSGAYPRTETAESPIANWQQNDPYRGQYAANSPGPATGSANWQQHDPYRGQDAANSGAPEWQKAPDLVDGAF